MAIPKERLDREVLPLSASAAAAAFALLLLIALPVLIVPDSAGRRNARSALKERVRGSTAERVVFSVVLMGAVVIGVWFALSPSLGLQGDDLAELEAMEGHVPGMEGRPIYMGVENLGDNGVILQIKARCREADSHSVRREITRRVYVMFNRNGIEVPFPQVTVHTPEENRQ